MKVHIDCTHNLWEDMISRWGGCPATTTTSKFKHVTRSQSRTSSQPLLRPLDKDGFKWPTLEEIATTQTVHTHSVPIAGERDDDGIFRCNRLVWIPVEAKDLVQQVLIIAHCGAQEHRDEDEMLSHRQRVFVIDDAAMLGFGTSKYLLVMKESFSHFCELGLCDTPTSEVATEG
ncbi:hypothetical protein PHMEG_00025359 [Phytophthora megakarya]|uniref:Uncharacterized protein n=1 Tax=Phytophthora megakarya TaxID=4795 RepID=A0A225VCZ6_9STRA|nr:hypothetical protein PHMEG_00025359 [Phytophthora megakarya]